jgi:diketogulonate reductase-like aldo/keto reductase
MREEIATSSTRILTNQVEYHPFKNQSEVLEFCIENDIILTAYSPLGQGRVTGNEVLKGIGKQYGKTASQVALRWLIQQELVVAIPKVSSQRHIEQNFVVFDLDLSDENMERIFDIQGGLHSRLRSLLDFRVGLVLYCLVERKTASGWGC